MTIRGANYKKIPGDAYNTPRYVVADLLRHMKGRLRRTLADPCPGKGNMLKEFDKAGYGALGGKGDFLSDQLLHLHKKYDIVTNPPYGSQGRLAVKFIERALEKTKPWNGRVIMLLPFDFDAAKTRRHLFTEECFAFKIVLPYRIAWFDGKSGSTNHAWFVWDYGATEIRGIEYMEKQ